MHYNHFFLLKLHHYLERGNSRLFWQPKVINFNHMEQLKIDRTKLMTKSAYAKMIGVTPAAVDKMVKTNRVKTIKIQGGELIYTD